MTQDDAESAATYALCLAAAKFDPGRGNTFSTYATIRMRWELARAMTNAIRVRSRCRRLSLGVRHIPAPDNTIEFDRQHDAEKYFDLLVKRLHRRLRVVIELRFKSGYTLEEVGRILRITRERVRQIEARAITKLRHPNITTMLLNHGLDFDIYRRPY